MLLKPWTSGAEPYMQVRQLGSQVHPPELSYKNVDLCTQRLKQLLSLVLYETSWDMTLLPPI